MVYTKSDAPVQKSIDTGGTETGNAHRYRDTGARVYLNPDGLPVAFQPGRLPRQPGSFAGRRRIRLVTPRKTVSISRARFEAYRSRCAPLN